MQLKDLIPAENETKNTEKIIQARMFLVRRLRACLAWSCYAALRKGARSCSGARRRGPRGVTVQAATGSAA